MSVNALNFIGIIFKHIQRFILLAVENDCSADEVMLDCRVAPYTCE